MCANQEIFEAIKDSNSSQKVIESKCGTYKDNALSSATEAVSNTPQRASSVHPFSNAMKA